VLREADSNASRQCSLEDRGQEDGDGRDLGLGKVTGISELTVQDPDKKVVSKSREEGYGKLKAFTRMHEQTDLQTGSL
jgi:hypothetical protein